MRVEIEGFKGFNDRYEQWEDLIDDYSRDEGRRGRVVPPYALEILLAAMAVWMLEQAAEKAIDWAIDYRQRQRDEAARHQAAQQSAEALEKLERLRSELVEVRALNERRLIGQQEILARQDALVRALRNAGVEITVSQETEAEHDVARVLEQSLRDVPNAVVQSAS